MARIIGIGTQIYWGNIPPEELPKLPDGWCYRMTPKQWVLTVSPEGNFYYVSSTKLYPRRQREDTGTYFIETEKGVIEIPEKDHGKPLD